MNIVLILLVLVALGGGLYEHTSLQEQTDYDRQQIQDAQTKLDAFQANTKKLEDGDAEATQALADLQPKLSQITGEVSPLEGEIAQLKLLSFTPPPPPPPPTPVDPNDLGTLTTLTGQTYHKVHLLKVDDDGITFSYDGGITKILFGVMLPETQKKFGYNPQEQARLTNAQVRQEATTPAPDVSNAAKPPSGPTPDPNAGPPIVRQVPVYPPTSPAGP